MKKQELSAFSDPRHALLHEWLTASLRLDTGALAPASSDASFRRYFRADTPQRTYIVMDAPPPEEDVRPFLHAASLLAQARVNVPGLHGQDIERGFLLLDDFGSEAYLDRLNGQNADALYGDALEMLLRLQTGVHPSQSGLPDYDATLLHGELELFRDWFMEQLLGLKLNRAEHALLDECWAHLIHNALAQPQVAVHRDYHSRNLMVTETNNPGVLDFQDAVIGPLTYDAVSLLRDCYVEWPLARVESWALGFAARLRELNLLDDAVDDDLFLRWFDLMGIQRHLKAIGIFSRLKLRDGKTGYLKDIPRTLNYVLQSAHRHREFHPFLALLERHVVPRLADISGGAP